MEHAVERGKQRTLEQTLLAHRTNAVHDIESLTPPGEKRSDTRGIILQVRVHHDHDVAPGMTQSGLHGRLMAEISREVQDANVRLPRRHHVEDRRALVI